jgi:hypothetical protein
MVDSGEAAASTVGTDVFVKALKYALQMTGADIMRHIDASDSPGLLAPVSVVLSGKDCPGAILALPDRAIIAWFTGVLRIRTSATVIPSSSIRTMIAGTRRGGAMTKDRETLLVEADDDWLLVFADLFEGGRSIGPFLTGTLEGWLKPVFESSAAEEGDEPSHVADAPRTDVPPARAELPCVDGGTQTAGDQRVPVAVSSVERLCPRCSAPAHQVDKFCGGCGADLQQFGAWL